MPLQDAGRARDIADWLIGINLTIAMTKKFGRNENLLTIGRVQTPTLALIVNREKAIKNHVKTPFWKLNGAFSFSDGQFDAEYEKGNFQSEATALKVNINEQKIEFEFVKK